MPRHRLLWLEIAERQYLDLPPDLLDQLDARLSQLVDDPTDDPNAAYDAHSDQWSVPIADQGFVLYAVVTDPPTVIVLWLVIDLG
jgi:hypothetical protein